MVVRVIGHRLWADVNAKNKKEFAFSREVTFTTSNFYNKYTFNSFNININSSAIRFHFGPDDYYTPFQSVRIWSFAAVLSAQLTLLEWVVVNLPMPRAALNA